MPRRDLLAPFRPFLLHRRTMLAVKFGLASGLAWYLGAQLPLGIGEYAFYASLGAVSVIYPAVSDSVREAARATAAILLGVVLAALTQIVAAPNALTVAVVVTLAAGLAGLRFLGHQRQWVVNAALFVLVFSGDPPHAYIAAYVSQIVLGALVGLAVHAVLLPPMNLTSLEHAADRVRLELVRQLREMGAALGADRAPDQTSFRAAFDELEQDRELLRSSVAEARRSVTGNPRARRWRAARLRLDLRAEGLERIAFLVQDVGVVLHEFQGERYQVLDGPLSTVTAEAFRNLADLLDDPSRVNARDVERSVQMLMDQVDATHFEDPQGRYLAGVIAISARRCLATVTAQLAEGSTQQDPPPRRT